MRKLDIMLGVALSFLTFYAYANTGNLPQPIETGISGTDTSFVGARILSEGEEIQGGDIYTGIYDDIETQSYGFWQGDTPSMVLLSSIGLSHLYPSLPISMS